ncbi:MAG: RNA polymerase sigma factor RpoE [Nitrococcus mobilis]|nr:RNA polymerase sigma factor RpoE [Nitrococcus mobilis]
MAMQTKTRFGHENLAPATSKRASHPKTRKDRSGPASGAPLDQTFSNSQLDQMLVARVQAGDKQAFNALVQKYQRKLLKLISRYIHDQTEAMDVAQETFIKAYRALPKFRGDSGFYTWLYRIGLNTAKNHLTALGRRLPDRDIDAQEAERYGLDSRLKDHDSPEALTLRDEIEHTVALTLEELPQDLRTALVLRELKGLTYEEVARAMDCPIGTVRSRIYRARETVDKCLRLLLE